MTLAGYTLPRGVLKKPVNKELSKKKQHSFLQPSYVISALLCVTLNGQMVVMGYLRMLLRGVAKEWVWGIAM